MVVMAWRVCTCAIAMLGCGRVGFDGGSIGADAAPDPLTDPKNCGRVGHDCIGGGCMAGVCQPWTLATGELLPWGITVDATNVYWTTDGAPGAVYSCPLAGCGATPTLLASVPTAATRITVDAAHVYFSEFDAGNVVACPLAGCGANSPAPLSSGENQPMGVAVAAGNVYWADSGGTLVRMTAVPGGGAVSTLAVNQSGPRTLVADATNLYWTSAGGEVVTCPLAACPSPVTLASNQAAPYFIALYGGDVYWTNDSNPGSIAKCAITGCGGNPTTIVASSSPIGLDVDASGIYWLDGDHATSGSVLHCPIAGCGPVPDVLAVNQAGAFALVAAPNAVYWTNSNDGTVRAVAKP